MKKKILTTLVVCGVSIGSYFADEAMIEQELAQEQAYQEMLYEVSTEQRIDRVKPEIDFTKFVWTKNESLSDLVDRFNEIDDVADATDKIKEQLNTDTKEEVSPGFTAKRSTHIATVRQEDGTFKLVELKRAFMCADGTCKLNPQLAAVGDQWIGVDGLRYQNMGNGIWEHYVTGDKKAVERVEIAQAPKAGNWTWATPQTKQKFTYTNSSGPQVQQTYQYQEQFTYANNCGYSAPQREVVYVRGFPIVRGALRVASAPVRFMLNRPARVQARRAAFAQGVRQNMARRQAFRRARYGGCW